MSRIQELNSDLDAIRSHGLFRFRRCIDSPQGPVVRMQGREILNFCSNDYLGLANDPRLIKALQQGAEQYGVGSGASQLVCGHSTAHAALEEDLAAGTGRDRALVFASGYLANLSLITALSPGRDGLIVQDRLCHASLIDGAMLARAQLKRYRHGDSASLDGLLERARNDKKLVLTDSVFSMDGDIAPLNALVKVCTKRHATLAVDDAHGFGVLGKKGGGILELLGLGQSQVPVLMATFGKALGGYGAFIAGPDPLIEMLLQRARPYIYTTALPPALAVTAKTGLAIMRDESWRRDRLQQLIERFRSGAGELGLPLLPSDTPIQPLIIGAARRALEISQELLDRGILVTAIRPPTVPEHTARLRITMSAAHEDQHIDRLLDALVAVARRRA